MKNLLIVIVGFALLLASNYWGHIHPPFSVFWTLVLLGLIIVAVILAIAYNFIKQNNSNRIRSK